MFRFKPVSGYEGLYSVTDDGQVWSYRQNRWLSVCLIDGGYPSVNLSKKGKSRCQRVHIIVAQAFVANPENRPCVNHINGVKDDNRPENLEWCTKAENNRHARRIGLNKSKPKPRYGMENNMSKMTDEQVLQARELSAAGFGCNRLAREYGVSNGTMSMILNNKTRVFHDERDAKRQAPVGA